MSELIKIETILGINCGAQVKLTWGRESGLLSPEEARMHALAIMEAAEAAETDAFVFAFMQKTVGLEDKQAAQV